MAKSTKSGDNGAGSSKASVPVVAGDLTRIRVKLEGLPPGLMFQGKGAMTSGGPSKPKPPQEEAELRAHWMGRGSDRQLCIPSVMLYLAICEAGKHFKFKGKTTMQGLLGATVAFEQDKIPLGTSEFKTHVEYVRIPPKTGGMVEVGRPLLPEWKCEFIMIVDAEMYDVSRLEQVLTHAGKLVGIGAGRPQLKRPYGKFRVTEFTII